MDAQVNRPKPKWYKVTERDGHHVVDMSPVRDKKGWMRVQLDTYFSKAV